MTHHARRGRTIAVVIAVAAGLALAGCAVPADPVEPVATETATGAATTPTPTASLTPATSPSPDPKVSASATPTPSATPQPSKEETDSGDEQAQAGTALAAAQDLTVKGRAPKTGYDRDEFGSGWVDVDRNGCDTRNDMLQLRLVDPEMEGSCKVLAGNLPDPFTGAWVYFERGGASEVDIDHLVALSDAWQKGAQQWEYAQRVAFANDPLNLEPVDASQNRIKADSDAASWLPPDKAFRCQYVARQVAVKTKYQVWVTQAEQDAMLGVLDTCPDEPLPDFGAQPIIATNVGGPPPERTPEPEPEVESAEKPATAQASELDERYPYCKDLPSGLGPYVKGQDPEYEWYSDRDGDGVVCE